MTKLILLISILSLVLIGKSQVVNIEQQRIEMSDSNEIKGGLFLSSEAVQDKLSKFELTTGLNISAQYEKHLILNLTTYDVAKIEGTNYTNRFFNHTRYNYNFHKKIYVGEAFFQVMSNDFLDVDNRTLAGAGLRIRLINKPKLSLHFGFISMYEFERLMDSSATESFRSSDYLSLVYNLNDRINILAAVYYQPRYDNFKDYRVYNSFMADFKITKNLHYSIVLNILYDEFPAPGIKNTVYSNTNKLTFKF